MRIVIDTDVWLSGLLLPGSLPGRIVRAAATAEVTAVLSGPLLQEIRLALNYPRIRQRLRLSDDELERFLIELQYIAEIVDITRMAARVPRDRSDDMVLATFLASGADYLLTGDKDLLALRPAHTILTPREFHEQHLR